MRMNDMEGKYDIDDTFSEITFYEQFYDGNGAPVQDEDNYFAGINIIWDKRNEEWLQYEVYGFISEEELQAVLDSVLD